MLRPFLVFNLWLFLSVFTKAGEKDSLLSVSADGLLPEQYSAWLRLTELYDSDHKDSALWAAIELKKVAFQINDPVLLGESHRIAGIYYMDAGLHDQAIRHYYDAMGFFDVSTALDRAEQIAGCYHDLAWVLTYQDDRVRALEMFYQALAIYQQMVPVDSSALLTSYHALGSFYYLYNPNIDSAEYYLVAAIKIGEKLNYSLEDLAEVRLELANAYIENGVSEKATPILDFLKAIPNDVLSDYSQAYIQYLDGLNYHYEGNYQEAMALLVPIYDMMLAAQNHQSETGINLLRQIVKTADAGKFYDEAFHYLSILRETEQATIFKDRQRTTRALEIEFETARKEQQIAAQNNQLSLQRQILWISGFGLLAVSVLLIWVYRVYQKVRSKNKRIETLMRELHHRVKNNLQVISSLLGLQSMKLEDKAAQRAVTEGKERIRAMSLIHQKLYQEEEITAINIKDYIENLVGELAQSYGFANRAKMEIRIPDINLDADTTLPIGLIINELVSNAFKYAYQDIEEPVLELMLIQDEGKFNLSVRDNGHGLPEGFSVEQAQSFGLKLVNLLVRQLGGSLSVVTDRGVYCQIAFTSG